MVSVIQTGPADPQQRALPPQTERGMIRFHPPAPLFTRAGQLFFHPVELHLQPPDLLVQRLLFPLAVALFLPPPVLEEHRQLLHD
ncbi:MAG: hypothetical protein ACRD2P_00735 [Terriglobia bacterium]